MTSGIRASLGPEPVVRIQLHLSVMAMHPSGHLSRRGSKRAMVEVCVVLGHLEVCQEAVTVRNWNLIIDRSS